jgi:GntR family transcriptional regulator
MPLLDDAKDIMLVVHRDDPAGGKEMQAAVSWYAPDAKVSLRDLRSDFDRHVLGFRKPGFVSRKSQFAFMLTAQLAAEHLLVRRQGRGTFVATHAEQQVQYRFLRLVPDAADAASQGPAQRSIIDCKRLRAPADVARTLGLRTGDAVLQVRRVLAFQGVPTILEDLWLPGSAFKGLTAERLASHQGAMYALFETEFGVRMVRADEKLRAVAADAQAAEQLQVAPGSPLLSVERVAYTYQDAPMELRRGLYRTDTHHYHNDLN